MDTDYPDDNVPLFIRDCNTTHALSETGQILATTYGKYMNYPETCQWARDVREQAAWIGTPKNEIKDSDWRDAFSSTAGQAGRSL